MRILICGDILINNKPSIENVYMFNLMEAMIYLDDNDYPGIYDALLDYFLEDDRIGNGKAFLFSYPDNNNDEDYPDNVFNYLIIIKKEFNLKDEIWFSTIW